MEKSIETVGSAHIVNITERKNIFISGIKKVESFDSEEFLLSTNHGPVLLKGENLEIVKLDTLEGNITIKGKINSYLYLDATEKNDSSFFSKLFK